MKKISLILLIVIIFFLNVPVHIGIPADSHNNTASIFTLDVCNQHNSMVSLNFDTPGILENQQILSPSTIPTYHDQNDQIFSPFMVASQDERPPQV
ncbi:MAG: hypothetical protein A2X59_00370 [Nitrospirae bacterium GWC2_42_7]|nr:MAG: hypothetical protein A2X59_00370 [Nitrospirae bacterium GWC2_42_7]